MDVAGDGQPAVAVDSDRRLVALGGDRGILVFS